MPSLPAMPPRSVWGPLVERALAEDVGTGDVTSTAIFSADAQTHAQVEAREPLVVCGLELVAAVFTAVDPAISCEADARDGQTVAAGSALLQVRGPTRSVLCAERTALNFLGRMAGVATWTRRFVDAVAGTRAAIVDTRKTLPGYRALDKYAVATGGGVNHRAGLYDAVLIKDNHVAAVGSVELAVKAARSQAAPHLPIQVEVESLADARIAADAGADLLLLDNRSPAEIGEIVEALGERLPLEASGGITLENVRSYAETGVARISIGALTHSAPQIDVALEVVGGAGGSAGGGTSG